MQSSKTFSQLGLSDHTLEAIKHKGFEIPTPVQEKVIPLVLQGGNDIVAQAQTGTGKTAAFGLPLIDRLKGHERVVQALILTPTRELAIQVAEEINSLKGRKHISIVPVYGGQSIGLQIRSLKRGVDIVVGTPGRVLDHLRRGTLRLHAISYLVLDEADEMLNMGFIDDVKAIIEQSSLHKRTLLFSATIPTPIMDIAKTYMKTYSFIKVSQDYLAASKTDQLYFEVTEAAKFEALCRIIDKEEEFYGLVFCRTKKDAHTIAQRLRERGYNAGCLHGDISQSAREHILAQMKKGLITILVATDVAARGIDVQNLTHVINYALPYDPQAYVHRIGRTGRAGKTGVAITFVTPSEYKKLQYIRKGANAEIRRATLPQIHQKAVEKRPSVPLPSSLGRTMHEQKRTDFPHATAQGKKREQSSEHISTKKQQMRDRLKRMIRDTVSSEYLELSRELLEEHNSEQLIAMLLQLSFRSDVDSTHNWEEKKRKNKFFHRY